MSRTAITCPACREVLAYARRGGWVVPRPGVALSLLPHGDATLLHCPREQCGAVRRIAGRPLISSRNVLHSGKIEESSVA
jgi:hypothetical protein